MALPADLLAILVCPDDHGALELVPRPGGAEGLRCQRCRRVYPIRDGIPVMLVEEAEREASNSGG